MADEREADLASAVLEIMALHLISLAAGSNFNREVKLSYTGNVAQLRVMDGNGDIALHVVGEDSGGLGSQLTLACLHNISIEHLGALHLKPLNKPLRLQK